MTEQQHPDLPVQPAPQFAVAALQEENERLNKQRSSVEDRVVYLRAMQLQADYLSAEAQTSQAARITELEAEVTRLRAENDQLLRQVDENANNVTVARDPSQEAQERAFAMLPAGETEEHTNGFHELTEPQE